MKFFIISVIAGVVWLIIASRKKATSIVDSRPDRSSSFEAKTDSVTALKKTVQFAQQNGYTVDLIDESSVKAIFSDSASAVSYGFFYIVCIFEQSSDLVKVEVGTKSKLNQTFGPVIAKKHERFVSGLNAYLFTAI